MRRRDAINSQVLRQIFEEEFEAFFDGFDVVISAPGIVTITGEKVIPYGSPGTCILIPRRTYVGLRRRSSGPSRPVLDDSVVLGESDQPDRTIPIGPKSHHGEHTEVQRALRIVAEVLKDKFDRDCSVDVRVWSEWEGETGLGWSGSFSSALSCALLLLGGKLTSDSEIWSRPTDKCKDLENAFRLGWIVEAVLHGGGSSGMAVCAPLLGGALPISYKAKDIPKLWAISDEQDLPKHTDFDNEREVRRKQYQQYFDYMGMEAFRIGDKPEIDKSEELEVWRNLFDCAVLVVVHTNVDKSSADTNEDEAVRRSRERLEPLYTGLATACESVSRTVDNLVHASSDLRTDSKTIKREWNNLMIHVGEARGLGAALGFTFPVAEEILGSIRSETAGLVKNAPFQGKPSGAGTGGNLLVVGRRSIDQKMNKLYNVVARIRNRHNELYKEDLESSSISIMYDTTVDGPNLGGVKVERDPSS